MRTSIIIKSWPILFCMAALPHLSRAEGGKPFSGISCNLAIEKVAGDTVVPKDSKENSTTKDDKNDQPTPSQVVKVIPKARRQPVPVPVKVNVQPVKIIKPKIIKPVVKPVIKILH